MREVWETLSKIDVSEHIEKKGNLSYLSWAWAWGILMKHYPDAKYTVHPIQNFSDGTVEVSVELTIADTTRFMWLPVLNHQNKPIANPNAFEINTAKMRCLTKCIAMFGLGHYIYAGEDLPPHTPATEEYRESIAAIKAGIADGDLSSAAEEWFTLPRPAQEELWKATTKGGCFTTKEREVMKTKDFRQAYYGADAA